MSLRKTAAVLTALALTACASTTEPTATPIKTVEVAVLPPVPSELLLAHERPERLIDGSPEQLLIHANRFGAYCQKLETQVRAWQTWYQQEKK